MVNKHFTITRAMLDRRYGMAGLLARCLVCTLLLALPLFLVLCFIDRNGRDEAS
jgi:hypothetical protein